MSKQTIVAIALYFLSGTLFSHAGEFQQHVDYATDFGPSGVAVGDFDHDGAADLVTANVNGTISVLLGTGDGTFQSHVDYAIGVNAAPVAVVVADFDLDKKLDVAVVNE